MIVFLHPKNMTSFTLLRVYLIYTAKITLSEFPENVCDSMVKILLGERSEPTLGCSIEISRDMYMYICRYVSYVKLTA